MSHFHHICLLTNHIKDPNLEIAEAIVKRIRSCHDVTVSVTDPKDAEVLQVQYSDGVSDHADLMIVIGGDGSVLDASPDALDKNIPLLGINLGHLGYLAEMDIGELDKLTCLFDGGASVTERMTLSLAIERKDGSRIECERLSANEIALLHVEEFGLADLTLTDATGNRIRYRGDGLIVSTPTGSTGYSFSAGGPILSPELENICVTPICPHSFFNRSMIVGRDAEIYVTNTTHHDEHVGVCIDGRNSYILEAGDRAYIRASDKKLKTITFGSYPTFNTLRRKMELAELKD